MGRRKREAIKIAKHEKYEVSHRNRKNRNKPGTIGTKEVRRNKEKIRLKGLENISESGLKLKSISSVSRNFCISRNGQGYGNSDLFYIVSINKDTAIQKIEYERDSDLCIEVSYGNGKDNHYLPLNYIFFRDSDHCPIRPSVEDEVREIKALIKNYERKIGSN